MSWIVYILRCGDESLYTGITNDMERRLGQHTDGTGAKYTRGRGPCELLHTETFDDKGTALKREAQIKALSRMDKLKLVSG
ncbi:MAG TPA: GIY-YIG nuclease family protein [Micavibrio sp.]|jgi:putative endonuclease